MNFKAFFTLGLATLASAWLPQERLLNHFNQTLSARWLPAAGKIRGVNLGSLFILEPWMASDAWNAMGCGGYLSEFDCMSALGQARGDLAFQNHWNSWITQDDIRQIASLGLNTIRIPVGYWMREDIVYRDSEWFPQGSFPYLERVCNWAADLGMYIIIDLHGAPGAQVGYSSFTGQYAPTPGFYQQYQYERAYKFLEWMAGKIHTNSNLRNVGMLEVMNEPITKDGDYSEMAASLISDFYPNAWKRIREAEDSLNVGATEQLHIQMMDENWRSGNPKQNLPDEWHAAYDDHRYIKWTDTTPTRAGYLSASCHDDRGGDSPTIVGEWSLSVTSNAEWGDEFTLDRDDAASWYRQWYGAQIMAYEKQAGWIFWSWKANWIDGRNEWRWSYQAAVAAGAIPQDPQDVLNMGPCDGA